MCNTSPENGSYSVVRPTVVPAVHMESSRELSYSNFARKGPSYFKAFLIASQIILLLLETNSAGAEEDWPKFCTRNCKCTWVGWKEKADCQGAGFYTIPSGLSPELQVLNLSLNWISHLAKNDFEKEGLVKLEKVYLRSSKIQKIDRDAFRNLKVMIELDLSGNELESLHMETFEFNELTVLRKLRLNGNPLAKLHGLQFPPLLYLKLLDLSNCQLSELKNNTFDHLSNLEQLDLAGNKFQYISEQIFKSLTKIKSLSLQNNSWKCDCRLRSFRDWIIDQDFYLPITCTEPGRLKATQWSVLQSIDFACKPEIAALQICGRATQALTVYVDVGSDITLECLVRADPAPEVKWIRDGQLLANSSLNHGRVYLRHISSGEYERLVTLTILKSDLDDAGDFVCVGNNTGGVVEKNLILNFQDALPAIRTRTGSADLFGDKPGADLHRFWVWVIIGVLSSLVSSTMVVFTVHLCFLKRRVRTAGAYDLNAI